MKHKNTRILIAMLLSTSMVLVACEKANVTEKEESVASIQKEKEVAQQKEDEKKITKIVETYCIETIYDEFEQQDTLYNKFIMCSSVNFLYSLVEILDEKIGDIKADFGVNKEVAEWLFENYEETIEDIVYDKKGNSELISLVTKNCKTKIKNISATENQGEYEVEIEVANMDLLASMDSMNYVSAITQSLLESDIVSKKNILSAAEGALKGVIKNFGDKKKIFMSALDSLLASCGEEANKSIKNTLVESMKDCMVTNIYIGTIKVIVHNGQAYIVEEDKNLIYACFGVFDKEFLTMEQSTFYAKKIENLVEVQEARVEQKE